MSRRILSGSIIADLRKAGVGTARPGNAGAHAATTAAVTGHSHTRYPPK
jgi:hypothetical protein